MADGIGHNHTATSTVRSQGGPEISSRWKKLGVHHESHLLSLPTELRDQIYQYTLVEETPKWYKTHRLSCTRANDGPFPVSYMPRLLEEWYDCSCGRRTDLALRLANKQIYEESSKVLLRHNVFCFSTPEEFNGFIRCLPCRHRTLLRHVSLMRVSVGQPRLEFKQRVLEQTFDYLTVCTGLRSLQLDVVYLAKGRLKEVIRLTEDMRFDVDRLRHLPTLDDFRFFYCAGIHDFVCQRLWVSEKMEVNALCDQLKEPVGLVLRLQSMMDRARQKLHSPSGLRTLHDPEPMRFVLNPAAEQNAVAWDR